MSIGDWDGRGKRSLQSEENQKRMKLTKSHI